MSNVMLDGKEPSTASARVVSSAKIPISIGYSVNEELAKGNGENIRQLGE